MYLAGYIVTGFLVAGAYAFGRLRGRWGRYERTALAIPLTVAALASLGAGAGRRLGGARRRRRRSRSSSPRSRGSRKTTRGAPEHLLGWYADGQVKYGIAIPHAALAARLPQLERDRPGARRGARRPTARRSTSCASRSRRWSGSARCSRCSRVVLPRRAGSRRRRLPESRLVLPRASSLAGPLSVVALIAGWVVTEVGRQPWVVYHVMRTSQAVTGAQRDPGRLRHARRWSTSRVGVRRRLGAAPPRAALRSSCRAAQPTVAGGA